MAISRRAFGVGLVAASVAGTGGYLYLREHPEIAGRFGQPKKLFGFAGGEKEGFLANARVRDLLERRFGLVLDARRAGSVEMVREPALLDQHPQFLWPSSSVLVEVARSSGLKLSRDQVIFTSPIVIYSWDRIADGLVKGGFAEPAGGPRYTVDLLKLLKAIIAGESWTALGVADLFGRPRVVSTDPTKSNSGFMFAGLAANLLSGDVVTVDTLGRVDGDVATIFRRMGFKPSSSGKLFDDYVAGGAGAQPLVVGYENQLVEWVMQDPERWKRLEASAPAKPVMLYPRPTVLSAHPLISLVREADELVDALTNEATLELAWEDHGFRGPLGTIGKTQSVLLHTRMLDAINAVLPMPEAAGANINLVIGDEALDPISGAAPHRVAIRASFKSLLIESEAPQFSALLIQGGNGANFPRCGDRTKAAHGYVLRGAFESLTIPPPRSDQTQSPTKRFCSSKLSDSVEFSVPVFAGIVVIATGEFDEHARLIARRPRIVTRWQQHHIVL